MQIKYITSVVKNWVKSLEYPSTSSAHMDIIMNWTIGFFEGVKKSDISNFLNAR